MVQDKILKLILETVTSLRDDVGTLKSDVGTLTQRMGAVEGNVGELKSEFFSLHETVDFLKDNMVSKADAERFATKDDLNGLRRDLMEHIDGFVGLHKELDIEHNSLRSKVNRLEKEFIDFRGQRLAA